VEHVVSATSQQPFPADAAPARANDHASEPDVTACVTTTSPPAANVTHRAVVAFNPLSKAAADKSSLNSMCTGYETWASGIAHE
jgi:hypothetical protein